jgi:hypothetical protein
LPAPTGQVVFTGTELLTLAATLPAPLGSVAFDVSSPPITLTLAATLAAPLGSVAFAVPDLLTLAATLAAPLGSVVLAYDSGVASGMQSSVASAWGSAIARPVHAATPWGAGDAAHVGVTLPVIEGRAAQGKTRTPWQSGAGATQRARAPWQSGRATESAVRARWVYGHPLDALTRSPWQSGQPSEQRRTSRWRQGAQAIRSDRVPWQAGLPAVRNARAPWAEGHHTLRSTRAPWHQGHAIHTYGHPWSPHVDPVIPPIPPGPNDLVFCHLIGSSTSNLLFGDPTPCVGYGPPGALVVVPIRKVYVVINDTHLIKLAGMIELPTLGMQITLDVDSWTYGFSATLPADQLSLVTPAGDGTPVMLACVINSVSYYMVVESIQRDRSFNTATIRIGGRGKNAMLDAPYALTQSFHNTVSRTAAQLLDDALTLNGVSIGWSVDSGLTDWLVPAGAWSVVGSHIAAAQTVAGAAGGYLQPHPTADTLRVLARYPTAPWDWAGVTPDYELPSSVTIQEGITWTEKARYNRVFVSGQGQGVLGQVTRYGTAGDVVAPMITDALITEAAAARQRGTNVLADTGRIATVSLRLPVLSATGIIGPGKFVRYVDGATTRFGIVRSTSVDVGFPEVWQTIGVETHE